MHKAINCTPLAASQLVDVVKLSKVGRHFGGGKTKWSQSFVTTDTSDTAGKFWWRYAPLGEVESGRALDRNRG